MTIQDFMLEGRRFLEERFRTSGVGEIEVKDVEIIKPNDERLHGFILRQDSSMVGANVYVDELFERHEAGEDMEDLLDELFCISSGSLLMPPPVDPGMIDFDLDSIRSRLTVKLLDVTQNRGYMSDKPYIDVGCGLALAAVINCEESISSEWVLTVTESVLESIGCDKETLLSAALANTMRLEKPVLMDLSEYMYSAYVTHTEPSDLYGKEGIAQEEENSHLSQSGTYLLTNKSSFHGAAVLFYPGVMERLSELLGEGYYVLPSSVHELIIIPDGFSSSVEQMRETVKSANNNIVSSNELLSYNVFHYSREDGKLSIVQAA